MGKKRRGILKNEMPVPLAEEKFHLIVCPLESVYNRKFLLALSV